MRGGISLLKNEADLLGYQVPSQEFGMKRGMNYLNEYCPGARKSS